MRAEGCCCYLEAVEVGSILEDTLQPLARAVAHPLDVAFLDLVPDRKRPRRHAAAGGLDGKQRLQVCENATHPRLLLLGFAAFPRGDSSARVELTVALCRRLDRGDSDDLYAVEAREAG